MKNKTPTRDERVHAKNQESIGRVWPPDSRERQCLALLQDFVDDTKKAVATAKPEDIQKLRDASRLNRLTSLAFPQVLRMAHKLVSINQTNRAAVDAEDEAVLSADAAKAAGVEARRHRLEELRAQDRERAALEAEFQAED